MRDLRRAADSAASGCVVVTEAQMVITLVEIAIITAAIACLLLWLGSR